MDLSLQSLLSMARFTVQSPREGARMVMQAKVPMSGRWAAFALMAVMSSVLAHLSFGLLPVDVQAPMGNAMTSPFRTVILQAALMLVASHAIVWIGRWRGGVGTFENVLILMVWLQFILLILQVIQIAIQVVLPPLADIVGFASVGIFLWLLSNFIAEVHKFQSVGKSFVGVIMTLFAMGLVLALVLTPFMAQGVR